MSAKFATGVYPLFCVACRRVVGAINVSEFEAMARAEESYVCHSCMEANSPDLEAILRDTPDGAWAELTLEAVAAAPVVRRRRHEPHPTPHLEPLAARTLLPAPLRP